MEIRMSAARLFRRTSGIFSARRALRPLSRSPFYAASLPLSRSFVPSALRSSRPHHPGFGLGLVSRTFLSTMSPALEDGAAVKVQTPEFAAILTPELMQIASCLESHGHELRLVGGVVRDLLMGKMPKDVDLATPATPDQMMAAFQRAGIRYIETGLQHGTLTVVINQKSFEITTLRIDTVTDGRHAAVDFTTDWKLDAERRDLTINAMYLGLDGTLYDYFRGRDHLARRYISFVGCADTRIKEDFLRILRYFRFHGRISDVADFDPQTLDAIRSNAPGLLRISGERIWSELSRILAGNNAQALVTCIYDASVAENIGLPAKNDARLAKLGTVHEATRNPVTLLMSLYESAEQWEETVLRWHLSNHERDLGHYVIAHRASLDCFKACTDQLVDGVALEKVSETIRYRGDVAIAAQLETWPVPKFPVNGKLLKDAGMWGVKPGPHMGEALRKLKDQWKASTYTLTAQQLLSTVSS